MTYHRTRARRIVCFVVLLLALVGLNSEKDAFEGFGAFKARIVIKRLQAQVEQLASTQTPTVAR